MPLNPQAVHPASSKMRSSAAWTDLALTPGLTARVSDEPMVPTLVCHEDAPSNS